MSKFSFNSNSPKVFELSGRYAFEWLEVLHANMDRVSSLGRDWVVICSENLLSKAGEMKGRTRFMPPGAVS